MTKPVPATHNAYTAHINPAGASPILTMDQVWAALEQKVQHAEWFVAGALKSTDVLSVETDDQGHRVTTREVVFVEDNRRIREVCTEYPKLKVEFKQPCGGLVCNIVSQGPGGPEDLCMTYTFQYLHPGASDEEIKELTEKRAKMSKMAVEGTIEAIRKMVQDGRIK
ncbi:hypothetical protein, variant [Verruconis gallopava]|uniref:DUF1857-domain-containing protein n=1 Tax=Verruconis gallopava TaxID=253628 RepID=A0A0D1XS87_9PEZI|nr:uncharacterized protein PV09_03472 [Verruconis gallopava]XP_016215470.1 hypothetical protein, variant [Verruconis gallopava]KIW05600.1 hypothetical protein PV09_03472 [Verruconis gallopava]KIW05601.1 hypothetical protein, variant [Verruconis gallopava]